MFVARTKARRAIAVICALSNVIPAIFAIGCSGGEHARESSRETQRSVVAPHHRTTMEDESVSQRAAPWVVLEPPGRDPVTVRVEVARTPAQTQQGLMYRRELDRDAGMLFLFPRSRHQTFWMRNTYLPLDMIFITSEMRVLGVVEDATPETDDARAVDGVSQFVLEVNAGFAREHGIGPGTLVRFENVPALPGASASVSEDDEEEEWED